MNHTHTHTHTHDTWHTHTAPTLRACDSGGGGVERAVRADGYPSETLQCVGVGGVV